MANKKIIEIYNKKQFLIDLSAATEIMIFAGTTGLFLSVKKRDLLDEAERMKIEYYMTRSIFKVKRLVMVIV